MTPIGSAYGDYLFSRDSISLNHITLFIFNATNSNNDKIDKWSNAKESTYKH